MAGFSNSVYKAKKRNAIISLMAQNRLQKSDVCRILRISRMTLYKWIDDPSMITYGNMQLLCGCFGISMVKFIYLLERSQGTFNSKRGKADLWYLEKQVSEAERLGDELGI